MHQLDDILANVEHPEDEAMREYLGRIVRKDRATGGLIYGMGHAVYTLSDPRAVILKNHATSWPTKKAEEEYNKQHRAAGPGRSLPKKSTAPKRFAPTWTCSAG